jgi:ATP-dependent helicase YprA (DUF1998 family)
MLIIMSSNFFVSVKYALERLGLRHFSLKPGQQQSIEAVYNGRDVFVWLPTGYGKSLCYVVLPFLMDHKLCLVGTAKAVVYL